MDIRDYRGGHNEYTLLCPECWTCHRNSFKFYLITVITCHQLNESITNCVIYILNVSSREVRHALTADNCWMQG